MLELFIMAVSLDPRLALVQILKTTQQILCTLKMKEDQQKVHKAPRVKLFQETAVCIFISVGLYLTPFSASSALSFFYKTQLAPHPLFQSSTLTESLEQAR